MNPISDDEADHLTNIAFGSLMKTITPDHIESKFLEQGYIRSAVGGLVATEAGHKALMEWQKRNV